MGGGAVMISSSPDYISRQASRAFPPPWLALGLSRASYVTPGSPKMAARWSSENVVVEFRDSQVNSRLSGDAHAHRGRFSGRDFGLLVAFLTVANFSHPFP